jgi:hypothetical protein
MLSAVLPMGRALKAKTSRMAGTKEFKLITSHYLDLPDLTRWLTEWRDVLLSEVGECVGVGVGVGGVRVGVDAGV